METNQMIERLKGQVTFSCLLEDKMKDIDFEESLEVTVGGRVTHVFDMSAIRFAEETEEKEDALIEDVYVTIDDGLGTVNVAMHAIYHQLLLGKRDTLLGEVLVFTGDAVRIRRDLIDPKTKARIPNPHREYDLRVFATSGHLVL